MAVSFISYFNPRSSYHFNSIEKFSQLSLGKKIITIALVTLAAVASFFILGFGSLALFRLICQTFSPIPPMHGSFAWQLKIALEKEVKEGRVDEIAWNCAIFSLLRNSYLDSADCTPRLRWSECEEYAFDAYRAPNTSVRRQDAFNDDTHIVDVVKFKNLLNTISTEEVSYVRNLLQNPTDEYAITLQNNLNSLTAKNVFDIKNDFISIAKTIQERYSKQISLQGSQVTYVPSIRDWIENKLFELLSEKNPRDSSLVYQESFSIDLCQQLIVALFFLTRVKGNKVIFCESTVLKFTPTNVVDIDSLNHVSTYTTNALNSKNAQEEPFITNEPLLLAKQFAASAQKDLSALTSVQEPFKKFTKWIQKYYYNPVAAQLFREKKPLSSSSAPNNSDLQNDPQGETYKKHLKKTFTIKKAWNVEGGCFLSCFYHKDRGNETLDKARACIATELSNNIDTYLPFVVVIKNFSKYPPQQQTRLLNFHWAIAEESSDESKRAAIRKRIQEVPDPKTFLYDVEMELFATNILHNPIWVYKCICETFRLDKQGKVVPVMIFGKKQKGIPVYVLDEKSHYSRLVLK